MPDPGTCKSCGAAILWAKTPEGKAMPLDAKPAKRVVLGRQTGLAHVLDTYMPHWATCPSADQHRAKPAPAPSDCIVVVDVETTGLDESVHEVIDVHAVLVGPDLQVIAEAGGRCPLLRPELASPEALAVNHYDQEEWAKTERPLEELLPGVLELVGRAGAWLGSNPSFDVRFIEQACTSVGLKAAVPHKLIDTAQVARRRGVSGQGRRPHSLDALCDRFGVSQDGAHSARADCLRALAVYERLTAEKGQVQR